ncbi:DUF1259 domain-containing protein [Streptomyces sp. YGL11-2]|uniref:DUF1259 domain-containing protein n=1 Tax=Streptomyces sp. YGL11-2 TaxID=3414028 RepID=UPI003CEEDAD3
MGTKGDNEHGTYHFHVPVAQKVTDTRANTVLPYLMEASTLLMFQPLGGGHAAVNGDFAMTANQVIQASLSVNLVALRPDAFGPGRSSVRGE